MAWEATLGDVVKMERTIVLCVVDVLKSIFMQNVSYTHL